MKAAVLYAKGDLRYADIPTSEPAQGELLVRVRAAGICGSDIPRVLGDGAHFFPIVLGHEFCGEVAEVGAGVDGFAIGDRVAGAPLLPCFRCEACQRGDYALCGAYSFIGSRQNGAFAEYAALPARNAVKLAPSVSFHQGAMIEPSTVALHALRHIGFRGGSRVAVVGCGTIGQFAGQWARLLGARHVAAFDIGDEQLSLAKDLFADEIYRSDARDCIQRATESGEYDCVLDAVGGEATLKLSLALAGSHATVCLIGTPTRDVTLTIKDVERINRRELWLTGSWMSYSAPFPGEEWAWTAQRFADGSLRYDPRMVGGIYPLSEAAQAFARYRQPGGVKGRILLEP